MSKTTSKKPLGRGLSSLLGEDVNIENLTSTNVRKDIKIVPIDYLSPGPWQVRKSFKEKELNSLSESIKQNGIFQPVIVILDKSKNNNYKIVAGERRWRAAQLAKLHEIPIIIRNDLSSEKIVEISLLENLERSDLNPIEEANGYKDLIDKYKYTQDQVAKIFSKSRPYITNFLRLLSLPEQIKIYIIDEKITIGHARALINTENPLQIANDIIKKELSVREVENILKSKKKSNISSNLIKYIDVEKDISTKIGLNTKIVYNDQTQKGTIIINFKNLEQLEFIIEKLKKD